MLGFLLRRVSLYAGFNPHPALHARGVEICGLINTKMAQSLFWRGGGDFDNVVWLAVEEQILPASWIVYFLICTK